MENRIARLALGLAFAGLIGCGSGEGAGAGNDSGTAGTTAVGSEGGAGETGQAGGSTQAGSAGEAGQTATTSTGVAGAGGSIGSGGVIASSTTKPTGGSSSGGKTTATSTSAPSTDVASQYVDAINAVRAQVSKPDNYTGTWAPLPNVVWSDTVAASAQAWANNLATTQNCNLVHESQNTYGENLAMGTNLSPKQAVDMWAGEKSKYTWSATYTMADFNAGSGHYTQLVWRKSTQVGCGSATCSRNVVISCRFSPPGNFMGQAAY
jgi:uncharacterized protein YkwD